MCVLARAPILVKKITNLYSNYSQTFSFIKLDNIYESRNKNTNDLDITAFILKLLTLASQRKLLDLIFFFKCLHGQCDLNVLNYVDELKSPYNSRNSELSYKSRFARTNVLKFSYFHRTTVAWNALPLSMRQSTSTEQFKSSVFSHLFEIEQS